MNLAITYSIICSVLLMIELLMIFGLKNIIEVIKKSPLIILVAIVIIPFMFFAFVCIHSITIGISNSMFKDDIILNKLFSNIPSIYLIVMIFKITLDKIKK